VTLLAPVNEAVLTSDRQSDCCTGSDCSDRIRIETEFTLLDHAALRIFRMTQINTVFAIEFVGDVLVLTLQGDSTGFRYSDIHSETNAVIRTIDRRNAQHLVINFKNVEIVGSIMISAIIKLARKITAKKGHAAFCCTSDTMREVMQSMNLTRLWPCFDSQEEAIKSFESKSE
jgi:anti-anti-sigma factor